MTARHWPYRPTENERFYAGSGEMRDLPQSAIRIARECDRIKAFLVEKNLAYGDSAGSPVRVFSKASTVEQLLVRIDDKLSRVARGSEFPGDDTILDLVGYLILLRLEAYSGTWEVPGEVAR